MQGVKRRKNKAKRCGAPKGGEERLPVEIVGYQQMLLQLVEVTKGVPNKCKKMLLTFWKVQHCKGGGGSSTVGGPKRATNKSSKAEKKKAAIAQTAETSTSSSKSSGSCKPQQQQAARKAATSNRIRSSTNNTNNNPEKVRAKKCRSRKCGRASSRGISVVFEAFFLDMNKICNIWSLTFSEVQRKREGKSIVKLFLQNRRGFTRQLQNSKRAHLRVPALQKHHQNSTTRPPAREKKSEHGSGRRKKRRNFGWSSGG